MKAIKYRLANILLILIAFLMLISACSNMSSMGGHGKSNNDDDVPEVTAVQISSIPEIMIQGSLLKFKQKSLKVWKSSTMPGKSSLSFGKGGRRIMN